MPVVTALLIAEPTFVETLTAWSTFGAATVTAISAAIIAWQSVQTRRSVKVTEEALELSRKEFDRNTELVAESLKARIDAEMPRLTAVVAHQSSRVFNAQVRLPDTHGNLEPEIVPEGTEFTMPRDRLRELTVFVDALVYNDGPRRASLTIGGPNELGEEVILAVDSPKAHSFRRTETLEEWIKLAQPYLRAEQRSPGIEVLETTDAPIGFVTSNYHGDMGGFESHRLVQGGSIVEPVEGNASAWRVVDPSGRAIHEEGVKLNAVFMPFERQYYRSRLRNDRLD